jgi:hypothetical protein
MHALGALSQLLVHGAGKILQFILQEQKAFIIFFRLGASFYQKPN